MKEYWATLTVLAPEPIEGHQPLNSVLNEFARGGWKPIIVELVDQPFYLAVLEREKPGDTQDIPRTTLYPAD